jgi:cbb3-type cytochrome oxidase subunit 1
MNADEKSNKLTATRGNEMNYMSNWFLRIAVLYLIAGVSMGLFMAASHDHSMFPVHAHLNLLGWVSMSLFGLFYKNFPLAAQTGLAKAHFWVYVPAHFVQMILLTLLFRGYTSVEPVLGVVSSLVGLAIVCFAVNVWKSTCPTP